MNTIENRELSKISLLLISTILTLFFIVLNPLGTAHSVEIPSGTIHPLSSIIDGDLIKTASSLDIYIVKIDSGFRYKRLIMNPAILESYGHLEWSNVKMVTQTTLNSFTSSQLVREVNEDGSIVDGRIFMLLPNGDTGIKKHIQLDRIDFITGGGNERSIYGINHTEASETFYFTGSPMTTPQEFRNSMGRVIRADDTSNTLPLPSPPAPSLPFIVDDSTPSFDSDPRSTRRATVSFTNQTVQSSTILPNSKAKVLTINTLSSNRGITVRRLNILLSSLMGQDTELENTFSQVQLVSNGNVIATKNISSSDDYQTVLNSSVISFGNLALDIEEDFQKSIEIHISTNTTLTESLLKDWNIVVGKDDIYSLDDDNNTYYNTNSIMSSFSVRRTLSSPTSPTSPPPTVKNFRATSTSTTSLTLQWTAFKDATGYELDYCTGSLCTDYTNKETLTSTTKTISSLTAGTIYRFRIRATKADNKYSGYKVLTQATLLSTPSLTVGSETKNIY